MAAECADRSGSDVTDAEFAGRFLIAAIRKRGFSLRLRRTEDGPTRYTLVASHHTRRLTDAEYAMLFACRGEVASVLRMMSGKTEDRPK